MSATGSPQHADIITKHTMFLLILRTKMKLLSVLTHFSSLFKTSIKIEKVHYGRNPFLNPTSYQRQGTRVNILPQIPDYPLPLGYFVVKGENWVPIVKKTLSSSKDQVLICIFMTIEKSIILIFRICLYKLLYLQCPIFPENLCQ